VKCLLLCISHGLHVKLLVFWVLLDVLFLLVGIVELEDVDRGRWRRW
jgi:hypothetical protein